MLFIYLVMNYVLFTWLCHVFNQKNKTLKKILEKFKKKDRKGREFVSPGKIGTMVKMRIANPSAFDLFTFQ